MRERFSRGSAMTRKGRGAIQNERPVTRSEEQKKLMELLSQGRSVAILSNLYVVHFEPDLFSLS